MKKSYLSERFLYLHIGITWGVLKTLMPKCRPCSPRGSDLVGRGCGFLLGVLKALR